VTSISGMLGFNPLQVLARRLRANEDGTGETILPPGEGQDGESLAPASAPIPRQRPIANTASFELDDPLDDPKSEDPLLHESRDDDGAAASTEQTDVSELAESRDANAPHDAVATNHSAGRR